MMETWWVSAVLKVHRRSHMWIRPVEILSVLIAIQKKFGRKKICPELIPSVPFLRNPAKI